MSVSHRLSWKEIIYSLMVVYSLTVVYSLAVVYSFAVVYSLAVVYWGSGGQNLKCISQSQTELEKNHVPRLRFEGPSQIIC